MNNHSTYQIMKIFIAIIIYQDFIIIKLFLFVITLLILKPLLSWTIKNLYLKIDNTFKTLKITNFFLNKIYILIYMSVFLLLLTVIRISRITKFFSQLFAEKVYFILILIILWLICMSFITMSITKLIENQLKFTLLQQRLISKLIINKIKFMIPKDRAS